MLRCVVSIVLGEGSSYKSVAGLCIQGIVFVLSLSGGTFYNRFAGLYYFEVWDIRSNSPFCRFRFQRVWCSNGQLIVGI